MKLLSAALVSAIILVGLFAAPASAHAKIVKCNPDPGSALPTAPTEVRCWFTEEIESAGVKMTVTDEKGQRADNNDAKLDLGDKEHKQVFVTFKTLNVGVYRVDWEVASADDHAVTNGAWNFAVGNAVVPTPSSENSTGGVAPAKTPTVTARAPASTRETVTDTTRTYVLAGLVILGAVVVAFAVKLISK